eukprot:3140910-Rhodomonas_salina.1
MDPASARLRAGRPGGGAGSDRATLDRRDAWCDSDWRGIGNRVEVATEWTPLPRTACAFC